MHGDREQPNDVCLLVGCSRAKNVGKKKKKKHCSSKLLRFHRIISAQALSTPVIGLSCAIYTVKTDSRFLPLAFGQEPGGGAKICAHYIGKGT